MKTTPENETVPPARRWWRWRWVQVLAGLAFGVAVLVALALTPPVQRWVVRKVIERQVGWRVRMVEFGVGPTGLEASGVVFTMPGLEARTEPVAIRIAPLRLLTRQRLAIERIEARKLRVVLTPEKFSSPSAAPSVPRVPFGGVLRTLRMPLAWTLDSAQVDGEIEVRRGADSMAVGAFAVQGGGFAGGHVGEFTYDVTVNSAILPPGPENKVRTHGTVRLTPNAAGGIARIEVNGELNLPHYGALVLPWGKYAVEIKESATGEDYQVHLDLGPSGTVDLAAQLDAQQSKLSGRLGLHLDQALAASLRPAGWPTASLSGGADFQYDLREGDGAVAFSGDIEAGDWGRLLPQLAVIDAFKGQLVAALSGRAGVWKIEKLALTLAGKTTPAVLHAEMVAPAGFPLPVNGPLLKFGAEHVPLATWSNPWLAPVNRQITPAEFSGEWTIGLTDAPGVIVSPTKPCAISPATVQGPGLPPLPPLGLTFSPQVELSAHGLRLRVPDFLATTARGDRLEAKLELTNDPAAKALHTTGEIRGMAATLFSEPEVPRALVVSGKWDVARTGTQWRLSAFEAALREGTAEPCVSLRLIQPLTIDAEKWTVATDTQERDWMRLKFGGFPLGWVSRWTPGRKIAGALVEGESALRSTKNGRLGFITTTPWHVANATYAVGGRTLFDGDVSVKPGFAVDRQAGGLRLNGLEARDRQGNRITGSVAFGGSLKDKKAATTIAFDLELPALPHSAETFGPLHGTLRIKSHTESPTIAAVETFSLHLRNDQRELLALEAPQPFLFGLSNSGVATAATVAPLRLTTGEIPLAWLRPWTGVFSFEGTLQPSEFLLTAQMTKFLLRPIQPLHVSQFAMKRGKREWASNADLVLYPGLDLTVACEPLPKFQLGYSGTVHVTDCMLDVGGARALDLDAALGFLGDDKRVLPGSVTLTTRLDFGVLSKIRTLAYRGCPAGGTLVGRIDGDALGDQPLELWARMEGVPSADGTRTLPAFEVAAHGHVSLPDSTFNAGVEARLETKPVATDMKFDASLRLDGSEVKTGSTLRSNFFDAGEALALAQAFLPKRSAAAIARAKARETQAKAAAPAPLLGPDGKPVYPRGDGPFWAGLRGYFDLEMNAVQFAPYRIDQVRGRLELDEHSLTLSQLSGEMFAGKWSGAAHIDYQPKNSIGDHALAAEFRIEQFDSAKVVQAAFPSEKALLGAKIDLHAGVQSRGNAPIELIDRAAAEFTVDGTQGVVRLKVPNQDTLAGAALFGGTILLSPELRALGRLLKQFAEMPLDRVRIVGERTTSGEIDLNEFRVESPQVRLVASGRIPAEESLPLLQRPLELSVDLGAKKDVAVILRGMKLIERTPDAEGYQSLKEKFSLGGKVGAPDTKPLYDLLAKAVVGSQGTWGVLMRKVQSEVEKSKKEPPPKKVSSAQ